MQYQHQIKLRHNRQPLVLNSKKTVVDNTVNAMPIVLPIKSHIF